MAGEFRLPPDPDWELVLPLPGVPHRQPRLEVRLRSAQHGFAQPVL